MNAKDFLGREVRIEIDRPLGSTHPKHWDIVYPVNYGYIPHTVGGDGEEIDVYLLGVNEPVKEYVARIIALVVRADDCEEKLVAVPRGVSYSKEEISEKIYFQERFFHSEIFMWDGSEAK